MAGNLLKVLVWFGLGFAVTEVTAEILATSGRVRHQMEAEQTDIDRSRPDTPSSLASRNRNSGAPRQRAAVVDVDAGAIGEDR